ncbi:hypothetical protein SAMN02746089_00897 [Caldanaerobius fijiensis DSM 17918]|uniref:Rubrerythrin n=1 Tax=Caldanaerobius fijiensis DSM 17918 TaxID=1121256 RepID=A0A1M4WT23_9THEO|nr:ferritin-like domain-containing protein [Caldanaerobius fijiensis]SHE84358.1 hypothetical protein SAMN02746089_00897 [Caldanaerobius fijiensis DSM 17918]
MTEYYDFISKVYYALIDEAKAIKSYNVLLKMAPEEDIEIIKSIIEDEEKHYRYFLSMYMSMTYQAPPMFEIEVHLADEYADALEDALNDELGAAKYYMQILLLAPNMYYKERIHSIIVDEQIHATKLEHVYVKED